MADEAMQTYACGWDALEHAPESTAALGLRSDLMIAVVETEERWWISPAQTTTRLVMTRLRFDDPLRRRVGRLEPKHLVGLAARSELAARMEITGSGT
ncbi:MAG: hypothetical protein P4L90_29130 [Rhodopila sp.]|nr:hypothetical protein [Rhodopila sp.]